MEKRRYPKKGGRHTFDQSPKRKAFRYWQEAPSSENYSDSAKTINLNSKKRKKLKRLHKHLAATNPEYSHSFESKNSDVSKANEINETEVYYEKILQFLKTGLDKEARDLFVSNALQESENKEVELSCHTSSSHCLELLLTDCKDPAVIDRFMYAFSQNKVEVCSNRKASHITELLIMHALRNIKNLTSQSDEENLMKNIAWIEEFSGFILENLNLCLSNIYSCHVMCTLIRALGGEVNEDNQFKSRKSRLSKEEFRQMYSGEDKNHGEKMSIILEQIPEIFIEILKKLQKSLRKLENIAAHAVDSSAATVIEALLLVLQKRLPRTCDKFVVKLAKKLYAEKNSAGIPLAFLHKSCSYIVESMFKAASEKVQCHLWLLYFINCLTKLLNHHIGNYIIQRLFDVVQDKSLFEEMCTAMWNSFDDILATKHYGIFVSLSSACNRLKVQQAQFTMNMMRCLNCFDSEEKQLYFIQSLLGFQKFENYTTKSSEISVCLQGSLVAQAMLKFHKPLKIIASLLNLKPEQLNFLAGHNQGCHVLNSFFGSISVGEKNKEKMINILKFIIVPLACDRNRSLTLSRIWVLLPIKLREIIVKELIKNEEELLTNQNGRVFCKKCGVYFFKKNREEWKKVQTSLTNLKKSKQN